MIDLSYPDYTRAERIADGVVHVAGIVAALIGIAVLFALWAFQMDGPTLAATVLYCTALVMMLTASATYHMAAHTSARPILRRLDHAAIFVKIAGTFTPLGVVLGTAFGYVVLIVVWACALIGAGMKLMAAPGKMTTGWVPYMALGWAGLALFIPLVPVLPVLSLTMIVAGGLLYTGGVAFYCREDLRFSNAIWHIFIVIASACFFVGITAAVAQGS
ncbi:PAQR family membrane homeostasis protein TrhA [Roseovarius pacificus]|uniref:PAQR family membrane homeostasis protein TrhA n=1 Tax=Roseovarius pacificus TaxID=337701 RepID=UPI004039B9FF